MTGRASARPARLTRFESILHTVAGAMGTRVSLLDRAIVEYHSSCDRRFREDLGDLPPAVRAGLDGLATLGTWTGDVGRAFATADAVGVYTMTGANADLEDVSRHDEDLIAGYLADEYDDPYLGAPAVGFPPGTGDPDEQPPSWLALAEDGSDALGVAELLVGIANNIDELPTEYTVHVLTRSRTVQVLSNGIVIETLTETELLGRALVPGTAPAGRVAFVRWAGRTGHTLAFLTSTLDTYTSDQRTDDSDRLLNAVAHGGIVAGGGALGGAAGGALAGTVCGPGSVVCSPALALVGGIAGAVGAEGLLDWFGWFQPERRLPLEHDLDELRSTITGAGLAPADEIAAWEQAADSLAGTPYAPEVDGVLDHHSTPTATAPSPSSAPPTGTTTTTLPPVPRPVPTEPPVPSPGPAPSPTPGAAPTPPATTTTTPTTTPEPSP